MSYPAIIGIDMRDLHRYLEPRPRGRAWVWAIAVALFATTLWFSFAAWENRALARAQEERLARMRTALQPKPQPTPSRSELELQRRWEKLESERSFAWYPILRALETTSSEDIELLEFSPDKPARRLVLRGEARDLPALFAYVQALSEQAIFGSVYLAQQKNKVTGTLTTVEFEIRSEVK